MANIEGKVHADDATQNIHPPLMQKTRIHIQPHTASIVHLLVKNTRETYTKQR